MIKDFGNSHLPRFKAGQALLDQVTAERLNDICTMIEACRLQNGVGYMLNRSANGTTFTVLENEYNRPPKLWKVGLDDIDLDPATIISKVINSVIDEIINAVSNPAQFTSIFYGFLSQIINAITSGNVGSASGVKNMVENLMTPIYQIIDTVDGKVEELFGNIDPIRAALENYFSSRRPRSGDMIYTDELGICYTIYKEVLNGEETYPTPNLIFRVPFSIGKTSENVGSTYYAMTLFPAPDIAECVKTILKAIVKFISAMLGSSLEGMTQAIMNAVTQALYALYEFLYRLIEMILEMIETIYEIINSIWNSISSLWAALNNLNDSLTNLFSNMLDSMAQNLEWRIDDLYSEIADIKTEFADINADMGELAEEFADFVSKATLVDIIDSNGKAINVKVLEKSSFEIDLKQQINWVHGITGTALQADALYWNLTATEGVKPVEVQVCENNQSVFKNFLERP